MRREHSLADRYLDRVLTPQESFGEFEAHLVDCQECRDRLLLAEMFHTRNGVGKPGQLLLESEPPHAPLQIRLLARFRVSQMVLIFVAAATAAILLLLASATLVLKVLRPRCCRG